jgi:hypothetical protein
MRPRVRAGFAGAVAVQEPLEAELVEAALAMGFEVDAAGLAAACLSSILYSFQILPNP